MDIASLIGIIIGLACLGLLGFEASHGNFMMFFSLEGIIAVGGGSISVVFMAMPMQKLKCLIGFLRNFMFHKGSDPLETVQLIARLSERARRDGILALESELEAIKEPFMVSALKMAVDGTDPRIMEAILRLELTAMQERHKAGKKFFDLLKLYGPGWGLVATLVGQIGMFGSLGGSVETMGKMLALAVTATMYGTVLANAVAGPIGDKLALRSAEEMLSREMMLQGALSIEAGDNPRVTVERITAFIPQTQRAKLRAVA